MSHLEAVVTEKAPRAIGPYSQAVVSEGWIHTSGQIALDPEKGEFEDGDIRSQATRVLKNLAAVLEAAGGGLDTVVKTTVFLADLGHFRIVNEIYAEHFGAHRPARSTIGVAELPAGAAIEVEAVARVRVPGPEGGTRRA